MFSEIVTPFPVCSFCIFGNLDVGFLARCLFLKFMWNGIRIIIYRIWISGLFGIFFFFLHSQDYLVCRIIYWEFTPILEFLYCFRVS